MRRFLPIVIFLLAVSALPQLATASGSVNFGTTEVGSPRTISVPFVNWGQKPAFISSVQVPNGFSYFPPSFHPVPPAPSCG